MDRKPRHRSRHQAPPDLQTQLEDLLHQVWRCEAEWRLDDRIRAVRPDRPTRKEAR